MGDKIVGRYEFGFENPSPGLHLMEAKKVDVVKNADAAKGWTYKVESVVIGGESDGRKLFENFMTRTNGNFALTRLVGLLIKMGVLKEMEYDTDMFETPQFENSFRAKVVGKKYGAEVGRPKAGKKEGTEFTNVVGYYTIKELKAKMGDGKDEAPAQFTAAAKPTPQPTPPPPAEKADESSPWQ